MKRKKALKINQIVLLGFGAVALVMLGVAGVTKLNVQTLVKTGDWVRETQQVKSTLQELEKDLLAAETGQRGFIFTGSEDFLAPYQTAIEDLKHDFTDLRNQIKDHPSQGKNLSEIEELAQMKLDELQKIIVLKNAGKEKEVRYAVLARKDQQIMNDLRGKIAEMVQVEENRLEERKKAAQKAENLSAIVSLGGTFVAIAFGILVSVIIARIIMRPIGDTVNVIVSSSTQIAATAEQQERAATQQASCVNQTTSTIYELGASSQQSATQAESAAAAANIALALSLDGTKAVDSTLEGMAALKEKVGAIADQIVHLSEKTSQIGNISAIVRDLARKTNMLAINAAVEAVRVGEYGKGFGVVATEIRQLADRSKTSAEKIDELVTEIQAAIFSTTIATNEGTQTVERGAKIARETANAFSGVVNAVNNIALNNQQISLTAQQQAVAIQQVVAAMNAINVAARETVDGISHVKSGTENLNEAAVNLKTLM